MLNERKCSFQAGRSFDLPNPDKYRHRYHMRNNWGGSGNVNKHNEATITFDTPERDAADEMRHGKQASSPT